MLIVYNVNHVKSFLCYSFSTVLLHYSLGLLLLFVSRPQYHCLGLDPVDHDLECRPTDIQLYTWSGPGFESGECWYQGNRLKDGTTWGRGDFSSSPRCVCEQGRIRIFYSQQGSIASDPLTLLRPFNGTFPTANDLVKWPTENYPSIPLRKVICSRRRIGLRVRSRDACFACKCSRNGHWLCRKPFVSTRNRTVNQQSHKAPKSKSQVQRINQNRLTVRIKPRCSLSSVPKFCILIERLSSVNSSVRLSRYVEIPRETSWLDRDSCVRCSCTLEGQLQCQFIHPSCPRPCLLRTTRPVPVMYYFASGTKWLTPQNNTCRSCTCTDGQRTCRSCDETVEIDVSIVNTPDDTENQRTQPIGNYRLLPATSLISKASPCLLKTNPSSHRLIYPGQLTWLENRCYFCSTNGGHLIAC